MHYLPNQTNILVQRSLRIGSEEESRPNKGGREGETETLNKNKELPKETEREKEKKESQEEMLGKKGGGREERRKKGGKEVRDIKKGRQTDR